MKINHSLLLKHPPPLLILYVEAMIQILLFLIFKVVYSCSDQIRNLEFCFFPPFLKVHETVNGDLITLFEVSG